MKKQSIAIAVVIAVGIALGALILTREDKVVDESGPAAPHSANVKAKTDNTASAPGKGPKGGKLFATDGFGLEVTIFETGVPPQFRLYLYDKDKPLPPSAARVTVTLSRLGRQPQVINFKPEADYLLGDQVVEEPHSFDVAIAAERAGKSHRWSYSQIEARVEMSDEALKSTGIEILTAGPASIKATLKLPGEIKLNEEKMVQVVPRLAGIVASVTRNIGQTVTQGEVLAVIESQSLAEMRSQYLAAQKRLALARTTSERERKLWEEKITAQQDYLSAQAALSEAEIAADLASARLRALGARSASGREGAHLTRYEIRAPISGVIVAKSIALGETLKEDTAIFTLADMTTVWAVITVYPKDLSIVNVGQRATIRASALDAEATGIVSYIGALVGEQTRTAQARVTLSNPKGQWRPGLFVEVEVAAAEARVPIAVAAGALQTVRDWTVVFGRYGKYFEARPLELGRSDGRNVEVLNGLSAGEQYAGGNSFAVKADLGKSGATHDH